MLRGLSLSWRPRTELGSISVALCSKLARLSAMMCFNCRVYTYIARWRASSLGYLVATWSWPRGGLVRSAAAESSGSSTGEECERDARALPHLRFYFYLSRERESEWERRALLCPFMQSGCGTNARVTHGSLARSLALWKKSRERVSIYKRARGPFFIRKRYARSRCAREGIAD